MILQEWLTGLFPAVEEAGGKLFPGNCGQKKIARPGSVRNWAFRPQRIPHFYSILFEDARRRNTDGRLPADVSRKVIKPNQ